MKMFQLGAEKQPTSFVFYFNLSFWINLSGRTFVVVKTRFMFSWKQQSVKQTSLITAVWRRSQSGKEVNERVTWEFERLIFQYCCPALWSCVNLTGSTCIVSPRLVIISIIFLFSVYSELLSLLFHLMFSSRFSRLFFLAHSVVEALNLTHVCP